MQGFCFRSRSTSNLCGVTFIAEDENEIAWMQAQKQNIAIGKHTLQIILPTEADPRLSDQIYDLCQRSMSVLDVAKIVQGHWQISIHNYSLNLSDPKLPVLYEKLSLQAHLISTPS